jgi:hypothetical protein
MYFWIHALVAPGLALLPIAWRTERVNDNETSGVTI